MNYLDDEVTNPILLKIAIEKNLSINEVREIVKGYYGAVVHVIESGKPSEIKLDYFAKIRAKPSFVEIEQKIQTNFKTLVRREYEIIPDKSGN
jgi:hypothetical protein